MNVVAIETATAACAVGVAARGGEWTRVLAGERHHTEALTPGLVDLLAQARLGAQEIDRVVVDRGPGLFTGLRVGVATAIALAHATGAELVAVTSTELLAHGAHAAGERGEFVACVDGRRGELFVQSFALGDALRELDEVAVVRPDELVARWRAAPGARVVAGDGVARYVDVLSGVEGVRVRDETVPPVLVALRVGATREVVTHVTPLYGREPDAVVNFATRERPGATSS